MSEAINKAWNELLDALKPDYTEKELGTTEDVLVIAAYRIRSFSRLKIASAGSTEQAEASADLVLEIEGVLKKAKKIASEAKELDASLDGAIE